MIAFALAADFKGGWTWGRMDFFLFVTVTSWLVVIAVFILFAFNVIAKINVSIDWNVPVRLKVIKRYIVNSDRYRPISSIPPWGRGLRTDVAASNASLVGPLKLNVIFANFSTKK